MTDLEYHYTFDPAKKKAVEISINLYNSGRHLSELARVDSFTDYIFDFDGGVEKCKQVDRIIVTCRKNIDQIFGNSGWERRKIERRVDLAEVNNDLKYIECHMRLGYLDYVTCDDKKSDLQRIAALLFDRFNMRCLYSIKSDHHVYVSFQTNTKESFMTLSALAEHTILNMPGRHFTNIKSRIEGCIEDSAPIGTFDKDGYMRTQLNIVNVRDDVSKW